MAFLLGQWLGDLRPEYEASALLGIEAYKGRVFGRVLLQEKHAEGGLAYTVLLSISADALETNFTGTIESVYDFVERRPHPADAASDIVKNANLPAQVSGTLQLRNDGLHVSWKGSNGNDGRFVLRSISAPEKSSLSANAVTWEQFKTQVAMLDRDEWIFRGQPSPWPLRTSYHRSGRNDLVAYASRDVNDIERVLAAYTNHWLDPSNPKMHAALLVLAQHHGYPTPLLDWTRSPYIAAYFAARASSTPGKAEGGRIFALNRAIWTARTRQAGSIEEPHPAVTVLDVVPYLNPRASQQQAVTTLSNVDDIETFIRNFSGLSSEEIFRWWDLPIGSEEAILSDLEWMGITEAQLFPGLDGSFRTLARRHFRPPNV